MGTSFPGLGRAHRHPLVFRGKVSSRSFSSTSRGPEVGAGRPLQRPPTPTPGSFLSLETSGRPAPQLLFRVPISPQPELYPSLRRRRASRDPGPGSPFKFDPSRVLAPILGLAGATRRAPSTVLCSKVRSAKARQDPPSWNGSPPRAPLPSPTLSGGTELPEAPMEPSREEP